MDPLQVTFSLVGVILVIIACYYVTYFISAKASGQSRGRLRNKHINIIDRFAFSRDKSFCIVEIAGKVYIIGVTNQSMTLLDTLDAAAFTEAAAERRDTAMKRTMPLMPPGGRLRDRMTHRLAAFMAARMGRTLEYEEGEGGARFEDSMKAAREKNASGQPDRTHAERPDDPEGEE